MADRNVGEALMGIGFGGYFFFKGIRLWRVMRTIEDTPLSKISSVAMGDAELSGEVKAVKLLKAPFSGNECVYCSYTVEVPQKRGWRQVDKGQIHSIFYLDDGSGQILVNPESAAYHGAQTFQTVVSGWGAAADPGVSAWVETRRSKSMLGSLGVAGRHRFTEYIVRPGQILFIGGAVSRIKHIVNGAAREEDIMGARASGHFMLSAYSEESLLAQMGWKAPLQIFGGMVLLLGCLWYVVVQLQIGRFI
ncbi:MAG: hypothetical protein A2992_06180 [Elusimicrobia bacterium RIFCSPLOWO2_01_FULL_59_12]|nr:MAG: hypothetical protein A2992_06180 [Elusimicrobia bacterium RIFCSPLOWO2_01_FULL_59_12]